jgi:Flp pilus assembly protein CpaB
VSVRSVVVTKQAVAAGASADELVRKGLVDQRPVAIGENPAGDAVTSVSELTGQTVTANVAAGQEIRRTNLRTTAPAATAVKSVNIPDGMQGLAISLPPAQAASGFVSPGDSVNVYANVAKATDDKLAKVGTTSPCTTLVAPNVLVVDVNPRPGVQPAGPSPANITYLLAVDQNTARTVIFFAVNESLYLTLVPHGQSSKGTLPCVSYAQEVPRP